MGSEIVKNEDVKKPSMAIEGFEVQLKSLDEFYRYATLLSTSNFVPKDYQDKPANVLVAIQMGAELGLKPLQALQNIAVINGRPSLWGDAILAIVQNSGMLVDFKEWTEGETAYCMMHRRGYSEATIRSFSNEDAKKAGLLGKQGPWSNYPARMRQMRARGFCARDTFSDILRGLHVAEEMQDIELESNDGKTFAPRVVKSEAVVVQNPEYSSADFEKNFPTWEKTILGGKKTADEIITLVESKAKLSDDQKAKIQSVGDDSMAATEGGVQ